MLSERELADALDEALVQEDVSEAALAATLRAHPNRRGAPAPDATQVRIGPYRVDFLYREERLVVEVDGYRFHRTKKRFVEDRRRTAYLLAQGHEVLPVTWWDLTERPVATTTTIRRAREARRRLLGLPALCD